MPDSRLTRFRDLAGLEHVQRELQERYRAARLGHSLLFVGPEGTGKRSIARAWVAWVCCANATDDACGTCPTCLQLAAGTFPDVLWVAATSSKREIGIDRAREVKRFLSLQPVHAAARIAVIAGADALTLAAQNALLKVLEEPPPSSWLVATTSTPDALLPTVRSRCQRIVVPPLSGRALQAALAHYGVSTEEAAIILPLAEGSVGRALQLRATLATADLEDTRNFIARLDEARYAELARFAEAVAKDAESLDVRLQAMLAYFRKQVIESWPHDRTAARRALARAEIVSRTWHILREEYPNRNLLLESMLVQMARAEL